MPSCRRLPAYRNLPSGREHHLGGVIRALEAGRQAGDGLLRRQASAGGVVIELDQRRRLLLDRIHPAGIGVESEMARAVARGQRNRRRIVRREGALFGVELPDENAVQAQVGGQHKLAGRIGLDHVGMRAVVAAEGKTAGRRGGGVRSRDLAFVLLHVAGGAERAVRPDGEHGDGSAVVVGHQDEFARGVDAEVSGTGALRADGIQQASGGRSSDRSNKRSPSRSSRPRRSKSHWRSRGAFWRGPKRGRRGSSRWESIRAATGLPVDGST